MTEPVRRGDAAVNYILADLKNLGLYYGGLDGALGPKFYTAWGSVRKTLKDSMEQAGIGLQTGSLADRPLAWGAKVSKTFRERVIWIANELGCDADDLMACIAWESGRTFSAGIVNKAGSGATGLIQFMPKTAVALGTTTAELARMTPEDQLNYVYKYFQPYKGRLKNLGDLYMAILWPAGVGKPDGYIMWTRATKPTTYRQNAGIDANKDGVITRGEALAKVSSMKAEGLLPRNVNK